MSLPKRYNPQEIENRLTAEWHQAGIYHFNPETGSPVYSIDTPPATVSGKLHLGHTFSYSHPDFIARFYRMNGYEVFYPMGFDDNGLPTERLVEKQLGIHRFDLDRQKFIEHCLAISAQAEEEYEQLWTRLGLSIDGRYTYRTIGEHALRIAQWSFIDLYKKGFAYRRKAPAIWCPECNTAIAQADLNDLERDSDFITLEFRLAGTSDSQAGTIPIATTRPELLPACVAVFVHPDNERYRNLVGKSCTVPIFGQAVPILEDRGADPQKGSGIVMCCTFGDSSDVSWWYQYNLPLVEAIDQEGRLSSATGRFAGLPVADGRKMIVQELEQAGLVLKHQDITQSIRVHERCDTPVEYILAQQWFINLLDHKDELLKAAKAITWHPEHMRARYDAWVENLNWDWCISRQRYYGVPFPVWYCQDCGEIISADLDDLPVDPRSAPPNVPCPCGSRSAKPETDVMDTWATSSMTPQIVGKWSVEEIGERNESASAELYPVVFPFSLRPQGHEIIRTWAFYTIAKSLYHFEQKPWEEVLISGWGLAGEGMGKISKSRGGGETTPMQTIAKYSADAVRYWAASTGPGKDTVISEEKIQLGFKLANKLWNVAVFCERFFSEGHALKQEAERLPLTPADRWILASAQSLIRRVTGFYRECEYAAAKNEIETFFWRELADNYLEMCKQRLYNPEDPTRSGALFSLEQVLLIVLKLFAPILPYVTDAIYQGIYAGLDRSQDTGYISIHTSDWPRPDPDPENRSAEAFGEELISIATSVRRYKSEHSLPLGTQIERLVLVTGEDRKAELLEAAVPDLASITRAKKIEISSSLDPELQVILRIENLIIGIEK